MPAFAATGTAYGHKIEYSNEKLSSVRAQAVTTCSTANNVEANLIHEAAIGRINSEQLLKLQTFGLNEEEAESVIIENFLN